MTDRATLDLAYANGSHIANSAAYPGVWADKAAAFRQGLGDRARLDLAYGAGARQRGRGIVVAHGDDILVLPRGRSQDVKKLIEAMKR